MEHIVKVLSVHPVTHDVKSFRVTRPAGYQFEPGQATEASINKEGWKEERRPFTFTGLNEWDYLEFTIKLYRDHAGMTNELDILAPGDELIIRDVWGAITYRGEGYFIAGGAGITPFIAILRQLKRDKLVNGNHLYFSNKTSLDIILKEDLDEILGPRAHYIVTKERPSPYRDAYIDKELLSREIKDFTKPFYICGPDRMVAELNSVLVGLGATPASIVLEK